MSILRRTGLLFLLLEGALVGGWALGAPRSFYDDFPGAGHHWTAVTGPYNEHFVTDVGAAYLTLTALAVLALVRSHAGTARLTGAAWVVFSAPHLLFHARHLDHLSTVDKFAQLTSLGATLVVAVLLTTPVGFSPSRPARPGSGADR